ncbi:hypothetical protein ACU4GI_28640 [Cupriavidus basilensis]
MNPLVARFESREDAAVQLAEALRAYRGQHPLILAIPKGGVAVGRGLADALEGDLDVMLVSKLAGPDNAVAAIGAVTENGWTYAVERPAGDSPIPSILRRSGWQSSICCGNNARSTRRIARGWTRMAAL